MNAALAFKCCFPKSILTTKTVNLHYYKNINIYENFYSI